MKNAPTLPKSPYIGLVPYAEADAPFFFGREQERDIIIENLRASRLTLLYGPSGVGKSSVLNAGVTYRLHQIAHDCIEEYGLPEFAVINFRDWSDAPFARFVQDAHASVAKALQIKEIEPSPAGTMVEILKDLTDRFGIELLIILDQFEENFYRHSKVSQDDFLAQLPAAINSLNLRAKFLISLRDDSLSKLDRFKTTIPQFLDNRLSIKHLNAKGAREAIEKPISQYNSMLPAGEPEYDIEPELVDKILAEIISNQETTAQIGQGDPIVQAKDARIEAVYLQLIMERIWENDKDQRVLRSSTLDTMKGLKNIVQEYLNKALTEKLDKSQQEIAVRVFDYLVTPSGIKISYTKSDLHNRVEAEPEELESVLKALNEARILKNVDPPLDQPDELRYEIFHDKLAEAVLKWQSDYKQARTLVEAEHKKEEARAEAEKQRLATEQTQRRRQRNIAASIVILLLLMVSGFAIYQWVKADNLNKKLNEELNKNKNLTKEIYLQMLGNPNLELSQRTILIKELDKLGVKVDDSVNTDSSPEKPLKIDPVLLKRWANGTTLRIRFMGGSPDIQNKVREISQEWTKYANLKFVFDSSPDADIRISFDDPIAWSFIGTDAKNIPNDQPNMNLGILNQLDIGSDDFRRHILHEFGHVLGLIHEHQQANANIPWNKPVIYAHFAAPPNNWTRTIIDNSIFKKYDSSYREFDRDSIMIFFTIPKEWLIGDTFAPITQLNSNLSASDKDLAAKLYPRETQTTAK